MGRGAALSRVAGARTPGCAARRQLPCGDADARVGPASTPGSAPLAQHAAAGFARLDASTHSFPQSAHFIAVYNDRMVDRPGIALDRASIRRFKSLPPGYLVVNGRPFPWAIHHFETKDLPNGWGKVSIYTDHAYHAGKANDLHPTEITVSPDELARVRVQLRERKRLREKRKKRPVR